MPEEKGGFWVGELCPTFSDVIYCSCELTCGVGVGKGMRLDACDLGTGMLRWL